MLEGKAKGAMKKYGMDLVIANELQTRRTKAFIYDSTSVQVCECKDNEVLSTNFS